MRVNLLSNQKNINPDDNNPAKIRQELVKGSGNFIGLLSGDKPDSQYRTVYKNPLTLGSKLLGRSTSKIDLA